MPPPFSAWVRDSFVTEENSGARQLREDARLGNVSVRNSAQGTEVAAALSRALPLHIDNGTNYVTVALVGTASCLAERVFGRGGMVRSVVVHGDRSTCYLRIETASMPGSVGVSYREGTLTIRLCLPWVGGSLRGAVIAVDAGHGGLEAGAEGPRGSLEKDINLAIARTVAKLLRGYNAKPILTRETDQTISPYERLAIAYNAGARLFLSLHCDSARDGEDPTKLNGFSVHWFQTGSFRVASAIHESLRQVSGLRDNGLHRSDFAVCRTLQMPAVLIECGTIIEPAQELMLLNPTFQQQIARAIVSAILRDTSPID